MKISNEVKSINGLKLCDETARQRIDNLVLGNLDLSNYYTKEEVYSMEEIDSQLEYFDQEVGMLKIQLGLIDNALYRILGGE